MKSFFLRISLLIAVLALPACGGLGLSQNFAPADAAVPAPGERWAYRVVNGYNNLEVGKARYEVVSAAADRFEVRVTDEASEASHALGYVSGWNPQAGKYPAGLAMGGFWGGIPPGAPVHYAPALPEFRFPLSPGKSWREFVTVSDPASGRQVPVTVLARVQGMERIRVPAGEFDTIKVSRDLYYQDAEWWRSSTWQSTTDWYAPAVNRVVRHREHSQYTDQARAGEKGGAPLIIYGDFRIHELVETSPARR
jgi:hypothetical protein